ncbi:polysaccharide deacetylase family protein [Solitalea sp. MAHUQ-68]|uniref:Polysaccharide deacetylase family protein n=1 Tax=Solitalea agri TaxID=2953739 RepID=A0A9X2F650_9SPHI|nr:polysaccharide deacetylase family protein [Solitalea agri]MCO4293086.1 polysaccharide deacetylase family protein [Solitalea agri]
MKKRIYTTFLLVFICCCSFAQHATHHKKKKTKAPEYTVEKWFNGKKSATCLTFDDWSAGHGAIVVNTLIERGCPATFFVTQNNNGLGGGYAQMQKAAQNGMEIGNHTQSHPDLTKLNANDLHKEVSDTQASLSKETNAEISTLAYPYGPYNDQVIEEVRKHHIAARGVIDINHFPYEFAQSEQDYFKLNTVGVNEEFTPEKFGATLRKANNEGGMLTLIFHSVYNNKVDDQSYAAITEQRLNQFLDTLNTYKNETWTTTMANAVKYHKEAHCTKLTTINNNAIEWTMSLTDTLSNNKLYNQPLTITIKVPNGQHYLAVSQGGAALAFSFHDRENTISFNAVPDGGIIRITKAREKRRKRR